MQKLLAALAIGIVCGAVAMSPQNQPQPAQASSEPAGAASSSCKCTNCVCIDGECHPEKEQVPDDVPAPTVFESQPELFTQPEPEPAKEEPAAWQPPDGYTYGGNGWWVPPGYQQSYSSGSSCGPNGCGPSRGFFGRRR